MSLASTGESGPRGEVMQPGVGVRYTSEHELYLRLFVTNAGGW